MTAERLKTIPYDNDDEKLYELKNPRRAIFGILIATFFLRIAFGSTTVLMPVYIFLHLLHVKENTVEGPLTEEYIFAIVATIIVEITYALAVILSAGYFGYKSDNEDTRKWILFSTSSGALVLIGYGICALNWQGIIGIIPLANGLCIFGMSLYHFLHGIAGACNVSASNGFLSRFSVYENRARRMGYYNVAVTGGRSSGVVLAGLLYDWIVGITPVPDGEWIPTRPEALLYIYIIFAVFLLLSTAIIFVTVDKTKPTIKEREFSVKQEALTSWRMMLDKDRRGVVMPLLGTASLIGILNNWGFIVLAIGTSPGIASYSVVLFTLVMGASMGLWGYVADKIGRRITLGLGLFGILGMAFILMFAYFANLIDIADPASILQDFWLLTPLVLCVILASAYAPAISGRLGDSSSIGFEEERHGSTMSVQNTVISLSEIIGIVVGGVALGIVALVTDFSFYDRIIALVIPSIFFLLFTTVATVLWPGEKEFLERGKVRRKN